jgi:hypothetical protein
LIAELVATFRKPDGQSDIAARESKGHDLNARLLSTSFNRLGEPGRSRAIGSPSQGRIELIERARDQIGVVTRGLLVPHGYALSVGGTLAMLIGERGYPGSLPLWMFVAASNATLLLFAATCPRLDVDGPHDGGSVAFNFAPAVAMPAAALSGTHLGPDPVAFPCAGTIATATYVILVAVQVRRISPLPIRSDQPASAAHPDASQGKG